MLARSCPFIESVPYPRAVRDYDAVELSLNKRLSNGWALRRASYLWSRLWGNNSRLANGDCNGFLLPSVGPAFDDSVTMFDERREAVHGPLPRDRPHQFKTQLIYDFAFGTSVGLRASVASGTPITPLGELGPAPQLQGAVAGRRLAPRSTCWCGTRSASAERSGCSSS